MSFLTQAGGAFPSFTAGAFPSTKSIRCGPDGPRFCLLGVPSLVRERESLLAQTLNNFIEIKAKALGDRKKLLNRLSRRAPLDSFMNSYRGLKLMAELLRKDQCTSNQALAYHEIKGHPSVQHVPGLSGLLRSCRW